MLCAPKALTGTPVLLATSVALTAGQGGIMPDLTKLQNRFRQPMLIEDIGFSIRGPAVGAGANQANYGGTVRVSFNAGHLGLTSVPIPIWNLGPQMLGKAFGTTTTPGRSEELKNNSTGLDTVGQDLAFSQYRWKLPKPFFLAPGAVLVPTFARDSDGAGGTVTVNVAYNARRLPMDTYAPPQIPVPYVALYATTAAATVGISGDRELFNPFMAPLYIQRLIGRLLNNASGTELIDGGQLGSGDTGFNIKVQITDTRGRDIVPQYTTFNTVFDLQRRAWTFPAILNPRERLVIKYSAPTGLGESSGNVTGFISLVGYRMEAFTS